MILIEINRNPSPRQLFQFGLLSLIVLPLVVWLWTGISILVVWAFVVGLCLAMVGRFAPRILRPLFVGLILITAPIGILVTEFFLLLTFFGFILPLSLLFRLLGRDTLRRRLKDRQESMQSCWIARPGRPPARNYYRQW